MTESQKRCASRSPRSTETQATRIGRLRGLDPGPQQHGLAAPRGRAHEDHVARAGGRQPVEQRPARYEPAQGRQALDAGALHHVDGQP